MASYRLPRTGRVVGRDARFDRALAELAEIVERNPHLAGGHNNGRNVMDNIAASQASAPEPVISPAWTVGIERFARLGLNSRSRN